VTAAVTADAATGPVPLPVVLDARVPLDRTGPFRLRDDDAGAAGQVDPSAYGRILEHDDTASPHETAGSPFKERTRDRGPDL
jgi:hypothetical protein